MLVDMDAEAGGQLPHLALQVVLQVVVVQVDDVCLLYTSDAADDMQCVDLGGRLWIDPAAFFSRGTSGQWRDLLDKADLARYAARVRTLASEELIDWVHRQAIT